MSHSHIERREPCCPCHRLPVAGGPARVWCRISGRQFHADDAELDLTQSCGPPDESG
jgi:hypothetical protein